jgi:hypothetical protein|tara:strand:+ start:223 stop:444 length:222 start_codon:yes stop_codon:yes gene_type:complete
MTNITILQSEIDQFLDGIFQVYVCAADDTCVSVYDAGGRYRCTLEADEATFEYISENQTGIMNDIDDPRNYDF